MSDANWAQVVSTVFLGLVGLWLAQNYRRLHSGVRRIWISSPKTAVNNAVGNFQLTQGALAVNGIELTEAAALGRYASAAKAIRTLRKENRITDPLLKEAMEQTDILAEGASILPQEARAVGAGRSLTR